MTYTNAPSLTFAYPRHFAAIVHRAEDTAYVVRRAVDHPFFSWRGFRARMIIRARSALVKGNLPLITRANPDKPLGSHAAVSCRSAAYVTTSCMPT